MQCNPRLLYWIAAFALISYLHVVLSTCPSQCLNCIRMPVWYFMLSSPITPKITGCYVCAFILTKTKTLLSFLCWVLTKYHFSIFFLNMSCYIYAGLCNTSLKQVYLYTNPNKTKKYMRCLVSPLRLKRWRTHSTGVLYGKSKRWFLKGPALSELAFVFTA